MIDIFSRSEAPPISQVSPPLTEPLSLSLSLSLPPSLSAPALRLDKSSDVAISYLNEFQISFYGSPIISFVIFSPLQPFPISRVTSQNILIVHEMVNILLLLSH